jgi:thymidylate kinase
LKPDLVLYFALSAEEAMKRSSAAAAYGERYEETEFQKTVAKNYETLFAATAAMGGGCEWRKIDASRDVEAIHKELEDIVTETMATAQHKTLAIITYVWLYTLACYTSYPVYHRC